MRKPRQKVRIRWPRHYWGSSRPLRPNPEVIPGKVPTIVINGTNAPVYGTWNYDLYRRSWTGERTPGFGSKRKRDLPINNHSVSIRRVLQDQYVQEAVGRWPSSYFFSAGSFAWHVTTGGVEPCVHGDTQVGVALSRLIEKAGQSMNNLALDFVELRQFTSMVQNTIGRITGAVDSLRHGNIPGAVNTLWQGRQPRFRRKGGPRPGNSLAQNWLELQYGWKPLLADVKGVAENLAQLALHNQAVQVVRSSARGQVRDVNRNINRYFSDGHTASTGFNRSTLQTTTKYLIRFRVMNPLTQFLAQTGFLNPLNLAWEVIPFSFVVDWFMPIGNYLESLSHWVGLEFLDGCVTKFTRQRVDMHRAYSDVNYNAWPVEWACGSYAEESILLTRVKLSTFPRVPLPKLKDPFSVTHALNAIALMRVVFK